MGRDIPTKLVRTVYFDKSCVYNGDNTLVVCDLLTGFVQGYHCRNQSMEEAVTKLRQFFVQYGFCSTIRTDSGPAFRKEFTKKMGKLGVQITHSSAYPPASNGCAESGIKTVKKQLKSKVRLHLCN